jgi:hypothetical protein
LTSFAGLAIFLAFFQTAKITDRIYQCFRRTKRVGAFGTHTIFVMLVYHVLMGWKRLRDIDCYRDDPLVKHVLGLKRMPDVSTVSRCLTSLEPKHLSKIRQMSRNLVIDRLGKESFGTVTVDFDGSVISTCGRTIEGTAVGFNRKKKGARSYYPLFASIAQTGQVIDWLHRPGNVHDSVGACGFVGEVLKTLRESLNPRRLEARLDSAHFNEDTCMWLTDNRIQFTVSVPFERFAFLKQLIEDRERWYCIDDDWSYFEITWKPKKWSRSLRLIIYRQRRAVPIKGPIQLDLFVPQDFDYEFKAVITNKLETAKLVLLFHNGRGSQEGVFAELKSGGHMDCLPSRRLVGNQAWFEAAILACNLSRELQMRASEPERRCTAKRPAVYVFEKICTLRKRLIRRAGRLTWPKRRLTLTVSGNEKVKEEFLRYMTAARCV